MSTRKPLKNSDSSSEKVEWFRIRANAFHKGEGRQKNRDYCPQRLMTASRGRIQPTAALFVYSVLIHPTAYQGCIPRFDIALPSAI